tara:strand:- start:189 stop:419 length:231 start_codon:yes stop_codon:yes gene_type:complete
MKKLTVTTILLVFGFILTSCGGEEIDACVGAASDPTTYDIDCDDCCKDNGYKRGIVSSTTSGGNTTRTCKCSGDPD